MIENRGYGSDLFIMFFKERIELGIGLFLLVFAYDQKEILLIDYLSLNDD